MFTRNVRSQYRPEEPFSVALTGLLDMLTALGVAHVLGHVIECQIYKSARHTQGLGLTDGENNERFQAFIVNFKSQLKASSPINFRITLRYITEVLIRVIRVILSVVIICIYFHVTSPKWDVYFIYVCYDTIYFCF